MDLSAGIRIILVKYYNRFQRLFWETKAESVHKQWGQGTSDYAVLSSIIDQYKPASILDIGCGSGRLFGLFREKQIERILGIDISSKALTLANRRFPEYKTIRARLDDLGEKEFGSARFDLAISSRVLQHIHPENIEIAIKKLCSLSTSIYINELSESDGVNENKYTFCHDYNKLLSGTNFTLLKKGNIDKQTFLYFSLT